MIGKVLLLKSETEKRERAIDCEDLVELRGKGHMDIEKGCAAEENVRGSSDGKLEGPIRSTHMTDDELTY